MNRLSADHASEAIVRATEHWETQRQARSGGRTEHAFTIALSRQTGARAASVARELGRRLGWAVYDYELLKIIAQEMGLREKLVQSVDERHVSWLREFLGGMSLDPVLSESGYVQHLIETLGSLSAHGHCIVVGRGAPFVLPKERTLRVRLVAPLPERVDYVARTFSLTRAEAEKKVRDTDRDRETFVRQYFNQDATDPVHYDLILNSARYSVVECAEVITRALETLQRRT